MEYKYCYIIDFCSIGIFRLDLYSADKKPEDFEDEEDLIHYWGFKTSQCSYMFTNEELDIIEINEPIK